MDIRAMDEKTSEPVAGAAHSMIPKSGSRFSEKIMLKQKLDFDPIHLIGSKSSLPSLANDPHRCKDAHRQDSDGAVDVRVGEELIEF